MKKLMFAAAVAAAGGLMAIESANVVGYNTQAVQGDKLYCIGLQFGDVGSADLASIGKLATSGITAGAYDTMETDAPCLMIYNGATYDYYYYIGNEYNNYVAGVALTYKQDFDSRKRNRSKGKGKKKDSKLKQ